MYRACVQIVLASESPRRRALLESLGLDFVCEPSNVDETRFPDEDPDHYVERLARAKATSISGRDRLVIGADTTVVLHGAVMGKPAHPSEARMMLRRLAGEAHTVHTGVAVSGFDAASDAQVVLAAVDRTLVRFVDMTDLEIGDYVGTGEPLDKAGAYGLQGKGAAFVERIEGSPSSVIGLPLHVLARLLRRFGVDVLSA